jgi:hypothetical protein
MQNFLSAIIYQCKSNDDWQWSWFTSLPFWRGRASQRGAATATAAAATVVVATATTAATAAAAHLPLHVPGFYRVSVVGRFVVPENMAFRVKYMNIDAGRIRQEYGVVVSRLEYGLKYADFCLYG